MDSDPWADSPATPRTGTPRVSLEQTQVSPVTAETFTSTSPDPVSPEHVSKHEANGETTTTSTSAEENTPDIGDLHVTSPKLAATQQDEDEAEQEDDGGFDDFDDFDAPEAGPSRSGELGTFTSAGDANGDDGDGFGDFGDFEEGDFDAPPSEAVAPSSDLATSWVSCFLWKLLEDGRLLTMVIESTKSPSFSYKLGTSGPIE